MHNQSRAKNSRLLRLPSWPSRRSDDTDRPNCHIVNNTAWATNTIQPASAYNFPRYYRVKVTRPATGSATTVGLDNIRLGPAVQ